MPPDAPYRSQAQEWLKRAKSSLALSQQVKPAEALWEDLCYMAQQAVEKAFKAVYIFNNIVFRYTHDLEELGNGLETHGLMLPDEIIGAVTLTKFAVATRYPGVEEPVTEDEYLQAVRLARATVEWADDHIMGPNT